MKSVGNRHEFWHGRRVLVTGHTGFKGSWLSLWLQNLGADVIGYALPPSTEPALFELARVGDEMESVLGDIRDPASLRDLIARSEPEVLFHLAAQPLVHYGYEHPVETYSVNLMGTVNVLEAVRATPTLRSVVVVTSDKCYENREWVWGYRERDALGGFDPYSSSKACTELIAAAYRTSYFSGSSRTALATARAGNVIGGGDWADNRLLPDIMRAALAGEPLSIRNPHSIRPWQHVLESLSGYLSLAEQLYDDGSSYAEAWNFGPLETDARPVLWIASRLQELWGHGLRWSIDSGDHPHEANYLKLDCSKSRSRLGWVPKLPLEQALQWTVRWYKDFEKDGDLRAVTLAQIEEYDRLTPSVL